MNAGRGSGKRRFSLRNSLMTKYLLIVLSAMVLLPFALVLVSAATVFQTWTGHRETTEPYRSSSHLEEIWHREAAKLANASPGQIDAELRRLKDAYPKASLFWVDGSGTTRLQLPEGQDLPANWTASYTVQFMKNSSYSRIYTVVAFLGDKPGNDRGFMVFKVPREAFESTAAAIDARQGTIFVSGILLVLGLFLFVSLLFFYRIRRRLVQLQNAMTAPSETGIPAPVETARSDEIGRLEQSFNVMVRKLERSREREAEEEALRRDLIARLSHDLRTPLTAIRGHAYGLGEEAISDKGRESLRLIDRKIEFLGTLIDNLLSFTLLSSGKYPYHPRRIDIVRMARTQLAGWYPAFEQAGFEIDSDLPEEPVYWEADPQWLERVVDNYLQNVLRHAKAGRYVALKVSAENGGSIVIEDRGPGMTGESEEKGAGIGLSIASLMLKDMRLRSEVRTGPEGTTVVIRPA
ncbi:HAMP domain-containing sensor histidine kinase [Cohnella zeiphila]|uniref:histidine kinase n=1 Tax=Cohnella zeiphila TaxID=2761120 RepID=A0A7X0SIF7_9BACL|nr:HAMP domain-containing sensor histidine kinase [Cohnella zeiphila]MBB6730564.1 HAMP domain-containing histidine kinase [Cohnella zeiphila]